MKHFNKNIIYILLITNFNNLIASQAPIQLPLHVINNNYHTNTNSVTHSVTLTIDFNKMFQSLNDAFNSGKEYISDKYQDSKILAAKTYQDLTIWLKNHKYVLVGAGAATVYSLVLYQLSLGQKILNDTTNWAN